MEKTPMPVLQIGRHSPRYPIVQGGMGVMISGPRLAGSVAACGGVGTIATVGIAVTSPHFTGVNIIEQNKEMLAKAIGEARAAAGDGVLAVNCMCALTDYDVLVRTSCEAGIDIIVSGAGLPMTLPELTDGYPDVALAPIVSSVKAANLIIGRWQKRYNRLPDALVVETPHRAGGHLGARDIEHVTDPALALDIVVPELVAYLKEKNFDIPVIAAGGIWDGADIAAAFGMGAKGVQMGTRFAATEEGDAAMRFKQAYIDAKDEDVVLINSPCGLPGRAIKNPLVERYIADELGNAICRTGCLSHCLCRSEHKTFCIADALVNAYRGDWENGLFFCGTNVSKVTSIPSVKALMEELLEGWV